jgi:uncharacterized membrane protein YgcG
VQHIRTKLGQHDVRKIYPNVYVIQSTFQVCSYFVYTECSNNVQHVNPNYKLTKFFWVAFVEKWPLQGHCELDIMLSHLHYNYRLQSASSAIVIVLHFLSMHFSSHIKANCPGGKHRGSVSSGVATRGVSLRGGGRGGGEDEGGGRNKSGAL